MRIPASLQDVHYRLFLELVELQYLGLGPNAGEEPPVLRAVERLTRGKVRVVGFYDSYHTEQTKMRARIETILHNKTRVFKFIYVLPNEDGLFLVTSKVKVDMWEPWREHE